MGNPFAKFFGKAQTESLPRITIAGQPLDEDTMPKGAEYAETDSEGCDCGADCQCQEEFADAGVIEKRPADRENTGTLGANAKKAELNQGYKNPGKGVQSLRASRIKFKED